MGMRLLPKSEIAKAIAVDKQREIDEGLKLAKRIDNLRETHAQEETSLEKFRRESIGQINEEISIKAAERDNLSKEVSDLEDRKKEALKPLEERWEEFNLAEADLRSRQKVYKEAELARISASEISTQRTTDANASFARATAKEERADARLLSADSIHENAEKALAEATEVRERTIKLEKDTNEVLTNRETLVIGAEKSVTIREEKLAEGQKELAEGWRLLKDRELIFERNLKRK